VIDLCGSVLLFDPLSVLEVAPEMVNPADYGDKGSIHGLSQDQEEFRETVSAEFEDDARDHPRCSSCSGLGSSLRSASLGVAGQQRRGGDRP